MSETITDAIDFVGPIEAGDPYAFFGRLRDEAPVQLVRRPNGLETWLVSGYEEGFAVLSDSRFAKQPERVAEAFRRAGYRVPEADAEAAPAHRSMLNADPPDHTRLRGLVNKAFTPRRVSGLRPRIEEIADGLVDRMAPRGRADLIAELAFPLPMTVICELLGVPAEDRDRFRAWTNDMLAGRGRDEVGDGDWPLRRYFRDLIATRRGEIRADLAADAQPDMVSALILARDRADRLSEVELLSMLELLLIAGFVTTVNLIGNGMAALFERPDQLDLLRGRPDLLPSAVEELLRYDGPVTQILGRVPTEDVEVGGVLIPEGSIVTVVLASADRDPRRFAEPDRLDIARAHNEHLAFGRGIHYCLGAPLARLEGQVAIGTLLRRLPDIDLGVPPDQLRWSTSHFLRGLEALPVRFTPAAPTLQAGPPPVESAAHGGPSRRGP